MVFGWLYVEKKRQEARREANALWREWNRRRMEAEANGEPFTESPPDAEAEHNRNSG